MPQLFMMQTMGMWRSLYSKAPINPMETFPLDASWCDSVLHCRVQPIKSVASGMLGFGARNSNSQILFGLVPLRCFHLAGARRVDCPVPLAKGCACCRRACRRGDGIGRRRH